MITGSSAKCIDSNIDPPPMIMRRAQNDKTDTFPFDSLKEQAERQRDDIFVDIMNQKVTVKLGVHHSTMKDEEFEDQTIVISICNICGIELKPFEVARVEY